MIEESTPTTDAPTGNTSSVKSQQPTHSSDAIEQKGGSSQKKNKVLIIIIILLVLAILALLYFLLNKDDAAVADNPTDGRATFVNEDNVDEMREWLREPVEDGYYEVSMSMDWTFGDGTSISSDAYVENSVDNTRTVYFDITLEDGTLVYSSPYLLVGSKIDEILLSEDLDAGDYPAVCTYHLVDEEHNEISTVAVALTLHILN